MKNRISVMLIGFVAAVCATVSSAQPMSEEVALAQIELARAIGQGQTRAVIEANLPLTSEERDAFLPLYEEYELGKSELNDRLLAIIVEYSQMFNSGEIDDKQANRLLNDYYKLEKDKISFKQKQFRKFKRALPVAKAVQFFQLDNKIDSLIDVGLAGTIPLILE